MRLGLQTGTPVYVMKDGKIVDLTREANGLVYGGEPLAVKEEAAVYRTRKPRRKK